MAGSVIKDSPICEDLLLRVRYPRLPVLEPSSPEVGVYWPCRSETYA